jgi:uncharacterized protein YfaA (DUF2138 family)
MFDTAYFTVFFIEISSSCIKQQTSTQLISSSAFQNTLKTENKHKLLFNSSSDKLLALLNRDLLLGCRLPNQTEVIVNALFTFRYDLLNRLILSNYIEMTH